MSGFCGTDVVGVGGTRIQVFRFCGTNIVNVGGTGMQVLGFYSVDEVSFGGLWVFVGRWLWER
jgi:hypothetical protein